MLIINFWCLVSSISLCRTYPAVFPIPIKFMGKAIVPPSPCTIAFYQLSFDSPVKNRFYHRLRKIQDLRDLLYITARTIPQYIQYHQRIDGKRTAKPVVLLCNHLRQLGIRNRPISISHSGFHASIREMIFSLTSNPKGANQAIVLRSLWDT